MDANKPAAEECIQMAKRAAADGDLDKAIRLLEKSIRLYPMDLAQSLLAVYKSRSTKNEENTTNNESGGGGSSSTNSRRASFKNTESTQNTTTTDSSSNYSSEQLDAVKKIKNCRDFYDILGVPKSASEADLKKAYRKLALQFHPDKNKAPGATEAFKKIGKAFAILNDSSKRKQYDQLGPDSFDGGEMSSTTSSTRRRGDYHRGSHYQNHYSWNDEDFSADELFNLFFGVTPTHQRGRNQRAHHTSYVFTDPGHGAGNSHAVLFQLMPILLIVVLTLLSNLLTGDPIYSLHKTERYNVKRATHDHNIPYFVKNDFKVNTNNELNRLEKQIEDDVLLELRQNCFRERSYKEAAVWRARNYGDERLIRKAQEYETPSCTKIKDIFGIG